MAEKMSVLNFVGKTLPTKQVQFPEGKFQISAMKSGAIITASKDIKDLLTKCKDEGITFENWKEPESVLKIASIFIDDFSALLSTASNIVESDLKELPPELLLLVVEATLDVNMRAKDTFLKNWNSLVESAKNLGLIKVAENTEKTEKKASPEKTSK